MYFRLCSPSSLVSRARFVLGLALIFCPLLPRVPPVLFPALPALPGFSTPRLKRPISFLPPQGSPNPESSGPFGGSSRSARLTPSPRTLSGGMRGKGASFVAGFSTSPFWAFFPFSPTCAPRKSLPRGVPPVPTIFRRRSAAPLVIARTMARQPVCGPAVPTERLFMETTTGAIVVHLRRASRGFGAPPGLFPSKTASSLVNESLRRVSRPIYERERTCLFQGSVS